MKEIKEKLETTPLYIASQSMYNGVSYEEQKMRNYSESCLQSFIDIFVSKEVQKFISKAADIAEEYLSSIDCHSQEYSR